MNGAGGAWDTNRLRHERPTLEAAVPKDSTIDPFYSSAEWRGLRLVVLIRDGKVCRYCDKSGNQADHVRPRSKGGADAVENLVCACARCNALVSGRAFRSFEAKRRWIRKRIVVEEQSTTESGSVTICTGDLPDGKGYRTWRKQRGGRRRGKGKGNRARG